MTITSPSQWKYRVDWDATDGRNGGAQQPVWEILLEMEWFKFQAGEKDEGTVASVPDLATAFERVSHSVVWAWATHFNFPQKILQVLRASEASAVRRMCGGAAHDHHGYVARVRMELLASAYYVEGCTE